MVHRLGEGRICLSSINHLQWSLPQKHEARTEGIELVCNSSPPSNVPLYLSQFFIIEDYGQCPLPDWLKHSLRVDLKIITWSKVMIHSLTWSLVAQLISMDTWVIGLPNLSQNLLFQYALTCFKQTHHHSPVPSPALCLNCNWTGCFSFDLYLS